MNGPHLPFRLDPQARAPKLSAFNQRAEIVWFGFEGRYVEPGAAVVAPTRLHDGTLGGGGARALNGGLISAGFDAAVVLAGLGHFDSDVVVTLELSTRFLALARVEESLEFRAVIVRSARHFAFAEAVLAGVNGAVYSTACAMVAPVATRA